MLVDAAGHVDLLPFYRHKHNNKIKQRKVLFYLQG